MEIVLCQSQGLQAGRAGGQPSDRPGFANSPTLRRCGYVVFGSRRGEEARPSGAQAGAFACAWRVVAICIYSSDFTLDSASASNGQQRAGDVAFMWYSHFSGSEMDKTALVVPHARSTVTERIGPFQQRALAD